MAGCSRQTLDTQLLQAFLAQRSCPCAAAKRKCEIMRDDGQVFKAGDAVAIAPKPHKHAASHASRPNDLFAQILAVNCDADGQAGCILALWMERYSNEDKELSSVVQGGAEFAAWTAGAHPEAAARVLLIGRHSNVVPASQISRKLLAVPIEEAMFDDALKMNPEVYVTLPCEMDKSPSSAAFLAASNQASIPPFRPKAPSDAILSRETLVWRPPNFDVKDYVELACTNIAFFRALQAPSSPLEDVVKLARRDTTLEYALHLLQKHEGHPAKALLGITKLVMPPLDPIKRWSLLEKQRLVLGLQAHGKQLDKIRTLLLPIRSMAEVVEFYYFFRTTKEYRDLQEQWRGKAAVDPRTRYLHSWAISSPWQLNQSQATTAATTAAVSSQSGATAVSVGESSSSSKRPRQSKK
eukprot:m.169160 g.169160  ORF g.169160 m.169160 type:complete len:410 (+) comp17234_c0_seq1:51-1280(+)